MEDIIYDLAGIGIGPFNLGLAALASQLHNFKSIFFDKNNSFEWHAGMMIDGTTLQVPFYADLVTLADPCNPFSFICFLIAMGRLFPFAIKENNYVSRKEYNQYCQWVAKQLHNLHFGYSVREIFFNEENNCFKIAATDIQNKSKQIFYAKRLILGTGMNPYIPDSVNDAIDKNVFHSSAYLFRRNELLLKSAITIIGSGQSAAEIFYDLLQNWHNQDKTLQWFTKSRQFFPMDVSKFSCEFSTPDYINYFYNLNESTKQRVLAHQQHLFKGINSSLLQEIYDMLYEKLVDNNQKQITLITNCELHHIEKNNCNTYSTHLFQAEKKQALCYNAEAIILATGYRYVIPEFIEPIRDKIRWTPEKLYDVDKNYSISKGCKNIFVQNAEMHTHGFNAPDLGLGAYRNAVILNEILGYERFCISKRNTFQSFG